MPERESGGRHIVPYPAGTHGSFVGESGSGKSVVAQTIMGILPEIARMKAENSVRGPSQTGNRD